MAEKKEQLDFLTKLRIRELILMGLITVTAVLANLPEEYVADPLGQVLVNDIASGGVISLPGDDAIGGVRQWIASGVVGTSHQGFPVVDSTGVLIGVVTRRDLLNSEITDDQPLPFWLRIFTGITVAIGATPLTGVPDRL